VPRASVVPSWPLSESGSLKLSSREIEASRAGPAAAPSWLGAPWSIVRTAQSDEDLDGFRFSLGHGVGLEPHEAPHLGLAGHDPLVAGDVLAIEPGL
jgi:hypothetical protein